MKRTQFGFVFFAIILAMVNLLTSDVYVSAFSEIREALATTETLVGWSLSIFFIGSVLTLPFYGPASDSFGRKPVLLVGLALSIVGTLGCFWAQTIEVFLVSRFIQAMGICSAYVLWQPMVVDIYPKEKVQNVFSVVMPFLGISPALGPLFGGILTEQFGWRSIFLFLLGLNLFLVVWTLFVYRESLPTNERAERGSKALESYRTLIGSKLFIAISLALGLVIGLYMTYLVLSPFILANLGLSPTLVGLTFLPIAAAFGMGGGVAKHLCKTRSELAVTKIGIVGAMLGSALLVVSLNLVPLQSPFQLILPFMAVTLSVGMAIPTGTSLIMGVHDDISGACSSGLNVISSLLAFIVTACSSTLLALYSHHALGMVAVAASVLAFISLHMLAQKEAPHLEVT